VEIGALRAKILMVLRTKIIVSADWGDSTDSTDSGWWDSFEFFSGKMDQDWADFWSKTELWDSFAFFSDD